MQAVATLLQLFYVLVASTVIFASSVPALRNRFVNYGKTAGAGVAPAQSGSAFALARFLDFGAKLTLPHHYFTHFYVVGVASTVFWGWQAWTHGAAYRCVAGIQAPVVVEGRWKARAGAGGSGGMRIEQVLLAWTCFLAQVCRRLYECLFVHKSGGGSSRMWFVHYFLGIVFYSMMAVSVWIEGTGAIDGFIFSTANLKALVDAPSLKSFVGLLTFFMASGVQYDCHEYLASLKKYSLPQHPFFRAIVCPHYLAECLIYLSLSVIAAPRGSVLNMTMFAGLILVGVNLGVSARINREWYGKKFGDKAVKQKWNMIPLLY